MPKKYLIPLVLVIISILLLNIFNLYKNNTPSSSLNNSNQVLGQTQLVAWGSPKRGELGEIKNLNNRGYFEKNILPNAETANNYKDFSTGYNTFGILDQKGKVRMQGDNRVGQIGDGTNFIYQTNLKEIELKDIEEIESNYNHSLAINKQGEVYSWGLNLSGQIGDGTNENKKLPVKILNLPQIESVSAGYRTSFGITKNGEVYSWGGSCDNKGLDTWKKLNAEIGGSLNLAGGYYDRAGEMTDDPENYNDCNEISQVNMNINSKTPRLIEDLNLIKQVSAGYGHFLALNQSGEVYSWGCNLYGQLGRNQNVNDKLSQKPTVIQDLNSIVQVQAGFRHSLALDKEGSIYSWGHNEYGELGNNSTKDRFTPQKIQNLPKIKKIIASHDYSLALDENNNLWTWGENLYKQVDNDPNQKQINIPQKLDTKDKFLDVKSKGTFIFAKIKSN